MIRVLAAHYLHQAGTALLVNALLQCASAICASRCAAWQDHCVPNTKFFDDIVTQVMKALPRTPPDLEKNLRGVLAGVLNRLDLVTREELEVQEAVLARTRARLAEMEKRVAELENKLLKKT
jgi:BMFP domain-containing protein YqiC